MSVSPDSATWIVTECGKGDGSYIAKIEWNRDEGCFWIDGKNFSKHQIDGILLALKQIKELEAAQ